MIASIKINMPNEIDIQEGEEPDVLTPQLENKAGLCPNSPEELGQYDRVHLPEIPLIQEERDTVNINSAAIVAEAEQREGFKTVEAYKSAAIRGNDKARQDAEKYLSSALSTILYAHSPTETPHGLICCTCSDGREGGTEMTSRNPLMRIPIRARPIAGNKMFPDVTARIDDTTEQPIVEWLSDMLTDESSRQRLFNQAEALFGRDIRRYVTRARAATYAGKRALDLLPVTDSETLPNEVRALAVRLGLESGTELREQAKINPGLKAKLARMGETFATTIELQSHSTKGEDHGCGAHGSDKTKALTTTAVNALILSQFIRERYPEEADNIKISLTHHFTGENGEVVDALRPDLLGRIDPSIVSLISDGQFSPLFQRDRENGLVRREKINHTGIDREQHSEYILLISEYIKAHLIAGESVLEQCMLPELDQMEGTVMTLLGIAQRHRIARDPGQPLFLHLDEPETNKELAERYHQLYERLSERADLKALIAEGKLHIIRSSSRPFSSRDPERLRVTFKQ